jgi:hypothetical protein
MLISSISDSDIVRLPSDYSRNQHNLLGGLIELVDADGPLARPHLERRGALHALLSEDALRFAHGGNGLRVAYLHLIQIPRDTVVTAPGQHA